ncbi:MAG: aminoacetone oxidase family FAD-binding enzyme [Clostridiales bacterium]|nr:aminoacetone oxidase family FAD-binding enzyme [Clostridiales bacterium]
MSLYDAIIIGAGSSGLMCAARLKFLGIKNILLLDSNSKVGKKLAITGNGRCNLTNTEIDPKNYYSDSSLIIDEIFGKYPVTDTLSFFEKEMGLKTINKEGLVYPITLKSSSVIDVLRFYLDDIDIKLNSKVKYIVKSDDLFEIKTADDSYNSKYLVIATGGCSYPNTGSDGSGFKLLNCMIPKEDFAPVRPVLVQLCSSDRDLKRLSGYRFASKVMLENDGKITASEKGELLFTDYGISGICIMQLSRYIKEGKNTVIVDLIDNEDDIRERILKFPKRETKDALIGILPDVLTEVILKRLNCKKITTESEIKRFINELHNFRIKISGTQNFDNAQVTRGGVMLTCLSSSLETRVKGLYVIGEAVNVDGPCGGYNLQWAWSSAFAVADAIKGALYDV